MNCIKCNSKKVEEIGKMQYFLTLFGTGSLFLFVGLIIWPLLIIAVPMLIGSFAAFFIPKAYKCNECKKVFNNKHVKIK